MNHIERDLKLDNGIPQNKFKVEKIKWRNENMKKDLNELTVEELKKELDKLDKTKQTVVNKGKEYCVVRTYSAGVFAGIFDRKTKGQEGTVYNARRIWYWDGAASLSQLANEGVNKPENCKFAQEVAEVDLKEIIEIIPCTKKARENIQGVAVWQK